MSNINISDGVTKQIIQEGSGVAVSKGDNITVHCTGSIAETNKKFWRCAGGDIQIHRINFTCGRLSTLTASHNYYQLARAVVDPVLSLHDT